MDNFFKVLLLLFFCCNFAFAQKTVKQVIIASGGNYSDPANKIKLFSYNPTTKSLSTFDSIPGRFTRDIVIDEGIAYVTADSMLYTYDLNTYTKKDSVVIPGINRMYIHKNFLVVSRWYPAISNFIQVYNKQTLALLYNDNKITSSTKGITVLRDTAYIAVNAFDSGKIAIISLSNPTPAYVNQINLDTLAKLTDDIFNDGANLVTLSYPFGAKYNAITTYNLASGISKYDTMRSAMEGIALVNNLLYANFGQGFNAYNTVNSTLSPVINSMSYYRGSYDSVNKNFYLIDFNFTSNNNIYILNNAGQVVDTFEVGMSTEAIAFDYKNTSGISENIVNTTQGISVYPNPSNGGNLNLISEKSGRFNISLKDITGRIVFEKIITINTAVPEKLNLENLPKGIYLLSVNDGTESMVSKVIIE